jgi:fructan beta-fructosidase
MASHLPHLAPSRPVVHLSTPSGWLNDPNGLCVVDGVWHAYYQHDPTTDVHGVMHWGHATSDDLLRRRHDPIALAPDELGVIYSGSIVVDDDDTAGFGRGAMVAVFTHHLDGLERQSLACSSDGGLTWTKFDGNPVLESAAPDFRDPKVMRYVDGDSPCWIMSIAAGRRIEFFRSTDLRSWERTGEYAAELPELGTWECPDLVPLRPDATRWWLLVFGALGAGPHGHSGTYGVFGDFDRRVFHPHGAPGRLDHGPDFYAAQTFTNAPGAVVLGWLNSWRYCRDHPSDGWRGILTLPRRLDLDALGGEPLARVRPAPELAAHSTPTAAARWTSIPDRALWVRARGDVDIEVSGAGGAPVATVTISDERARLVRHQDVAPHFAEIYEAPLRTTGDHEIIVDHGTLEVFAGGGSAALSALVFPGATWQVEVDGDAVLRVL